MNGKYFYMYHVRFFDEISNEWTNKQGIIAANSNAEVIKILDSAYGSDALNRISFILLSTEDDEAPIDYLELPDDLIQPIYHYIYKEGENKNV